MGDGCQRQHHSKVLEEVRGARVRRRLVVVSRGGEPLALKVGHIEGVCYLGDVRRLNQLLLEAMPVELAEEGRALYLLRPQLLAAEPLRGVARQQPVDDRLRVLWKGPLPLWLGDGALENLLVDLHRVVVVGKGRHPDKHLVDENTESPPVGAAVVALVQDDLRREILWGAAQGPRLGDHLVEEG